MIQISKTTDLLKAEPITNQIVKFGRNDVEVEVTKYITLCAQGLDIPMNNQRLQLLTEDLIDKYKYDSIEDIQQCLKSGRRGDYGPTYGKLNMIIISGWMAQHLEKKYEAREKANQKQKHHFKNREEYENAVKVGSKLHAEKKEAKERIKKDDQDYNNFKMNYEASKKK